MAKHKRYWGLKANGNIVIVVPSEESPTIEDFENWDILLNNSSCYEIVEVSVKQLRRVPQ